MPRFQSVSHQTGVAVVFLFATAFIVLPQGRGAANGAVVSGVVRDASGVVQMGALVQVLAPDSLTVGTAFTDAHGHYAIAHLSAGKYLVRASQSLCVPATRANLQLRPGAVAVVNLTLAVLFDTTSWLSAERRRADEPADDWKWTLRSSENRPILRMVDQNTANAASVGASETPQPARTKARETVTGGTGGFGSGGAHNELALYRALDGDADLMLRADVALTRMPASDGGRFSQEFEAGYESRPGSDRTARILVSYKDRPEMMASGTTGGLQVFSMSSAQRLSLGDALQIEVGGSLIAAHEVENVAVSHPFLRLTARPAGVWTLHYRMATDRQLQQVEDLDAAEREVPVAVVKNGRLTLETGRHQEVSVEHHGARATVEMAYYHDALEQVSVAGGGASGSASIPEGMLVDAATGSFRTLAAGYTTNGARITVSAPLTERLWVAAEYSTGDALAAESSNAKVGDTVLAQNMLSGLKPQSSQVATFALQGKLTSLGTRIRASYRWQPAKMVTGVDPYSGLSDQAYLGCTVRQPLHLRGNLPERLNATIDVTNLLAQGYRPFLSADGHTLYFAQSPRRIQAGLSFTF